MVYSGRSSLPVIFLIVILFFGAWVRFNGITEQGILLGDGFRHIHEAKLWATGQAPEFSGNRFYRPVSFFLQGMAIRIFGYNDYAIKLLHVIMDMISIILIFIIASILAGDLWAGAASSVIYAFLPKVVLLVRSEWLQVESTFFVLLTFFFFILFAAGKSGKRTALFLLFLSGFSAGLAANTHADLAFLAPGYVLFLFIKSYNSQNIKKSFKEFFILASIFTFSFFTPYISGLFLFGLDRVAQVFANEFSMASHQMTSFLGHASQSSIFFRILHGPITSYFGIKFYIAVMLLAGTVLIMIYFKFKKKKEKVSLQGYLPLILILFYAFFYSSLLFSIPMWRVLMPLLPLFIFAIALWYYKIFKQIFGKYVLIAFIGFSSILFLTNAKVFPGEAKDKYQSEFRLIYDLLKDDVNSKNKLLIAPVILYPTGSGFKLDLYFGKNAVYMYQLPINKEYNRESLGELLRGMHIRYIYLGKRLYRMLPVRAANPDFYLSEFHKRWLRNEKFHYSLEKDLEIIYAYIRDRGGKLIHENCSGKIYYLTDKKPVPQKTSLITNGSFEHWCTAFFPMNDVPSAPMPVGEWILASGSISKSGEAAKGLSSICFEPDDKKDTRIKWTFIKSQYEEGSKLRVRLDAKVGNSDKFIFFFTAVIHGKKQFIKPGVVRFTGKGDWMTLTKNFVITPGMEELVFHLWLRAGAGEPAFIDNLSIERLN